MKKYFPVVVLCVILPVLVLSACQRERVGCKQEEQELQTAQPALSLSDLIQQPAPQNEATGPVEVEISGRVKQVDMLVDYPLCNDNWSGTVYVSCDAQVAEAELDAEANPLFFKGCNLNIEPNTVVYVAAHNDAPYYKGCSCHTGEAPQP